MLSSAHDTIVNNTQPVSVPLLTSSRTVKQTGVDV